MATRAKYKVDQEVEFIFAGTTILGVILSVRKDGNKVSYMIEDSRGTKYPVPQHNITKKYE